MKILFLLLVLSACASVEILPKQEDIKIHVQVRHLNQNIEVFEVPLYAPLELILDQIECEACDLSRLNPQQILHDQDLIVLYPKQEQRISINQASLEELCELPGIGPSIAARIIAHREQVGLFQSLEDLMLIKGIKERLFAKLKDHISL
jgi:competence protein ComEA